MVSAAVTRFNLKTFEENLNYRECNNIKGCCYGTPVLLQENTPIGSVIYVFEMNNENNKIMGIGLIRNHNRGNKKYKIYSDGNYNRYNYQSDYRINRSELKQYNIEFLQKLETLVFKGYTHMKRGHGITLITEKKYKELNYTKNQVLTIIREMFLDKYQESSS